MFVTSKKAQEFYKVSGETLRQWAIKKEIEFVTTEKGHRRYKIFCKNSENGPKKLYIYARVSSSKQKKDLKNQINFIKHHTPSKSKYTIISDIGSGINFKRKGFKTILEQVLDGNVKEIVITNRDRLSRFSFELIQSICRKFGTKIIVIDDKQNKSRQQELADDIMSVITVFTARYYGSRKYKLLTKDKNIS